MALVSEAAFFSCDTCISTLYSVQVICSLLNILILWYRAWRLDQVQLVVMQAGCSDDADARRKK